MSLLKCPLCCSEEWQNKDLLINHLSYINSNLKCPICEFPSFSLSGLITHLKNGCFNSEILTPRSIEAEGGYIHQIATMVSLRKRKNSNVIVSNKRMSCEANTSASSSTGCDINDVHSVASSSTQTFQSFENVICDNETSTLLPRVKKNCCNNEFNVKHNINKQCTKHGKVGYVGQRGFSSIRNLNFNKHKETVESASGQTTESELDIDNISMQSDESSFTNEYSSSQNDVNSDDDSEGPHLLNRIDLRPSGRPVTVYHESRDLNNSDLSNNVFINNLQVINNNFYTILLNNGSYIQNETNNISHNSSPNAKSRKKRTTKDKFRFNNFRNVSNASSQGDNMIHNDFQHNETSQHPRNNIRNDLSNDPVTSPSQVSFNSVPSTSTDKFTAKNTNILQSTSCHNMRKHVNTENKSSNDAETGGVSNEAAMLENTEVSPGSSTNSMNALVTLRGEGNSSSANAESIPSTSSYDGNLTSLGPHSIGRHKLVINISNVKKIQNADCIQNLFDTASQLNPTVLALCKMNSFPLCNYIRTNHLANKPKLMKHNRSNRSVKLKINSENNSTQNNARSVEDATTSNIMQLQNIRRTNLNVVNNDIATDQSNDAENLPVNHIAIIDQTEVISEVEATGSQVLETNSIIHSGENLDTENVTETNIEVVDEIDNNHGHDRVTSSNTSMSEIHSETLNDLYAGTDRMLGTNPSSELNATSFSSERCSSSNQLEETTDSHNTPSIVTVDNSVEGDLNCNLNNTNNQNYVSNNNSSHSMQYICNINNNLHKGKRSNLNQLGGSNNNEDKFTNVTQSKEQQFSSTPSNSNCQMINNSIKRNFNKLNTSNQKTSDVKHIRQSACKRSKTAVIRLRSDLGGYSSLAEPRRPRAIEMQEINEITSIIENKCSKETHTNEARYGLESNRNNEFTASTSSLRRSNTLSPPRSSGKNIDNSSVPIIHNSVRYNSSPSDSVNTSQPEVRPERNELSKLNEQHHDRNLTTNQFNTTKCDKRNITKSNSLNSKNVFCEMNNVDKKGRRKTLSGSFKENNLSKSVESNNLLRDIDSQSMVDNRRCKPTSRNEQLYQRRSLENVAGCSVVQNENNSKKDNVLTEDVLEQFRLNEASNDVCFLPYNTSRLAQNENVLDTSQLVGESCSGLMNRSLDSIENNEETTRLVRDQSYVIQNNEQGPRGVVNHVSPQVIHNNIKNKGKKGKKCNEERQPLQVINKNENKAEKSPKK